MRPRDQQQVSYRLDCLERFFLFIILGRVKQHKPILYFLLKGRRATNEGGHGLSKVKNLHRV